MRTRYALPTTLVFLLFAATVSAAPYIYPVQNGDFEDGLNFWTPGSYGAGTHEVNVVPEGIPGFDVDILNEGSGGAVNWTSAFQALDDDVSEAACLYISARVKVISQTNISSLAQPCEFEFPALLKLHYVDATGHPRFYMYGFYLQATLGFVADSTEVTASEWYDFTSPNLMTYLPYVPDQLVGVEVVGVGWDYHSQFDNVEVKICQIPEPSTLAPFATLLAAFPLLRFRRVR